MCNNLQLNMKKLFKIIVLASLALATVQSCGSRAKNANTETTEADSTAVECDTLATSDSLNMKNPTIDEQIAQLPEEPVFTIKTNLGDIKVKLYKDTPKHRENFARLALTGFYDSLLFHRVINGFMIQGGDPLTKDESNRSYFGTGGPGYNVPAEISAGHKHIKGALAAARRGDAANPMKESSGSQFYIVQDAAACSCLDGEYTVYGETIQGLEVIDRIAKVSTDAYDCPVNEVRIISVKLAE